jgi:hypothetical protein
MRIWDLEPGQLCRSHLLGEHRELHAVWTVLTEGRSGYARHPEVLRWRGKLAALYARHESLVAEMRRRGYNHASPLDVRRATGEAGQDEHLASPAEQLALLAAKGCGCVTSPP